MQITSKFLEFFSLSPIMEELGGKNANQEFLPIPSFDSV